ncbi:MAG: NBR1-Ig-like domain-containing protein [Chloroflexi bacterium]|nr:NBR1-Ig-like domain-containing protein [Chloroflexota bacterium]
MLHKFRSVSILTIIMLFLSACNLPQAASDDPNTVMTVAAQTIEAKFTQKSLLTPSATFPLPVTQTPAPPSQTPAPVNSVTPTAMCDLALYVTDVSVPDGSPFLANQAFTKTWRLQNNGTCTWTSGYQVIFDNGDSMSGPATQALAGSVAPGQTVDISVNLKAPATTGSFRGYWKLRNPSGVLVPIANGYQENSFFVDIKVIPPTATVTPTSSITPTLIISPSNTPTPTP